MTSMPIGPYGWQSTAEGAPDETRAAAEAASGDDLSRRLEFARAWERYRRAVELHPSNEAYHYKLGVTAWVAGRPDLAEQHLLEALRLSPNFAAAHNALSQWYLESLQLERALEHSNAALLLDPRDLDYMFTRAAVLIADGQTHAGWELIQPLVKNGAHHPRLALLYAKLAGDGPRAAGAGRTGMGTAGARSGRHRQSIALCRRIAAGPIGPV